MSIDNSEVRDAEDHLEFDSISLTVFENSGTINDSFPLFLWVIVQINRKWHDFASLLSSPIPYLWRISSLNKNFGPQSSLNLIDKVLLAIFSSDGNNYELLDCHSHLFFFFFLFFLA
uniref:Uncharacterized protein n=1 Tax=Opuntia streptacantha TaxID=393608 RepID=A0A7C9AFX1_OPUST